MKEIIRGILAATPMPDASSSGHGALAGDLRHLPRSLHPPLESFRSAAVLLGLVERGADYGIILTERSHSLPEHPGQIAFPGGRQDEGDADLLAAALRETQEETGIAPAFVEPIGYLPPYLTISAYRVTPVVAFIRPGFTLRPEPGEVTEIFELPLSFLCDSANRRVESREFRGETVRYHVIPYRDERREYRIWGATAAMLVDFAERLAAAAQGVLDER